MFEKVNPSHPDKVADRIAGAIVDIAYKINEQPRIAVEVLIGHGKCHIIAESSVDIEKEKIEQVVERIAGKGLEVDFVLVPQDEHLARNQKEKIRCGDNGIFKGMPTTLYQHMLSVLVHKVYTKHSFDGKFFIDNNGMTTACQSNVDTKNFKKEFPQFEIVNPLGDWKGGTNVDCGATNRKLGSDMGDAVTGGGLHGKDLSKADVSLNIYAHIRANELNEKVELSCSIGDEFINVQNKKIPYYEIVEIAREYIETIGGFEKFAEWGLI